MKRALSLVLCFVLVHAITATDALALASPPKPSRRAAQVFGAVARLGAGTDSLVALRLQNQEVLKGRVDLIAHDYFVLIDTASGDEHHVAYAAVERLEGVNLNDGTRVHVGGGFRAAVARAAMLVMPLHRVQKNSLTRGEKTLLIGIAVGVLLAIVLAKAL